MGLMLVDRLLLLVDWMLIHFEPLYPSTPASIHPWPNMAKATRFVIHGESQSIPYVVGV
jgi:hypothetical protein